MNKILIFSILGFSLTFMAACGVKPSRVKPPENSQATTRVYPAPDQTSY